MQNIIFHVIYMLNCFEVKKYINLHLLLDIEMELQAGSFAVTDRELHST